jgi:hypothetical protein
MAILASAAFFAFRSSDDYSCCTRPFCDSVMGPLAVFQVFADHPFSFLSAVDFAAAYLLGKRGTGLYHAARLLSKRCEFNW